MVHKGSIIFLYSELAGYFLSCLRALRNEFNGEIYVVHWPVNSEAPFEFDFPEGVHFMEKNKIENLQDYVTQCNPTTIVSAGWMDAEYLSVCGVFKKKCKTILAMDNHWTGSFKQRLACMLSPFYLKPKFSHIWVPGLPQKVFADKLGFKNVLLDYYCGDVDLYQRYYKQFSALKKQNFPKRFLYVGRYVKHKGIFEMWEAFIQAIGHRKDWELWCIGTGDQFDNRVIHDQIKHFGFVQPSEMNTYIKETAIFVLPSKFEPWGVVVQEYAAAGFPMIVSKEVGAAEKYALPNSNAVLTSAGNIEDMIKAFATFMSLEQEVYDEMVVESNRKGCSYTPEHWANKILDVDACVV